jgi:hypothetical protein
MATSLPLSDSSKTSALGSTKPRFCEGAGCEKTKNASVSKPQRPKTLLVCWRQQKQAAVRLVQNRQNGGGESIVTFFRVFDLVTQQLDEPVHGRMAGRSGSVRAGSMSSTPARGLPG